jgi:hypothetical protein
MSSAVSGWRVSRGNELAPRKILTKLRAAKSEYINSRKVQEVAMEQKTGVRASELGAGGVKWGIPIFAQ